MLPSFFAPALALLECNVEDAEARVANNERRRAAQVPFAVVVCSFGLNLVVIRLHVILFVCLLSFSVWGPLAVDNALYQR